MPHTRKSKSFNQVQHQLVTQVKDSAPEAPFLPKTSIDKDFQLKDNQSVTSVLFPSLPLPPSPQPEIQLAIADLRNCMDVCQREKRQSMTRMVWRPNYNTYSDGNNHLSVSLIDAITTANCRVG